MHIDLQVDKTHAVLHFIPNVWWWKTNENLPALILLFFDVVAIFWHCAGTKRFNKHLPTCTKDKQTTFHILCVFYHCILWISTTTNTNLWTYEQTHAIQPIDKSVNTHNTQKHILPPNRTHHISVTSCRSILLLFLFHKSSCFFCHFVCEFGIGMRPIKSSIHKKVMMINDDVSQFMYTFYGMCVYTRVSFLSCGCFMSSLFFFRGANFSFFKPKTRKKMYIIHIYNRCYLLFSWNRWQFVWCRTTMWFVLSLYFLHFSVLSDKTLYNISYVTYDAYKMPRHLFDSYCLLDYICWVLMDEIIQPDRICMSVRALFENCRHTKRERERENTHKLWNKNEELPK